MTAEQSSALQQFRRDAKRRRTEDLIPPVVSGGASSTTTSSASDFPSAEFMALDRLHLAAIRSDEYPAKTGVTMLRGNSDVVST